MHSHLEGASGILGMIKAIMMLQHGCVLPNADFERFNESIEGRERLRVSSVTPPRDPLGVDVAH